MNLGAVEIQQTLPIPIAFGLEYLLRRFKRIERLGILARLKKSKTKKCSGLCFLTVESDVLELSSGAQRQSRRVPYLIQLNINFRLVQITQRRVAAAAGLFEMLAKPAEGSKRVAVSSAQIVQVRAIIDGLSPKLRHFELLAEVFAILEHLVGFLKLVHRREALPEIVVGFRDAFLIADLFDYFGMHQMIFVGPPMLVDSVIQICNVVAKTGKSNLIVVFFERCFGFGGYPQSILISAGMG